MRRQRQKPCAITMQLNLMFDVGCWCYCWNAWTQLCAKTFGFHENVMTDANHPDMCALLILSTISRPLSIVCFFLLFLWQVSSSIFPSLTYNVIVDSILHIRITLQLFLAIIAHKLRVCLRWAKMVGNGVLFIHGLFLHFAFDSCKVIIILRPVRCHYDKLWT